MVLETATASGGTTKSGGGLHGCLGFGVGGTYLHSISISTSAVMLGPTPLPSVLQVYLVVRSEVAHWGVLMLNTYEDD